MPWCHECEKEYPEGTEKCPECGSELFEEIPPSMMEPADISWSFGGTEPEAEWPTDEDGKKVEPAFLMKAVGTETDFDLVESLLRGCGIPVMRDYPNDGRFMRLLFGFAGTGAALYVPETMLEDAKAIIAESENSQEE